MKIRVRAEKRRRVVQAALDEIEMSCETGGLFIELSPRQAKKLSADLKNAVDEIEVQGLETKRKAIK